MALFFMEYSMHFNLTPRKTKTWQTVLYILSFLYLTVSTLLVLFLMERFIVNHTYWLLSIGLLIVLYIGFLIWLTLIHTQTRLIRIEPQQKFHNKATFSSYFYISIILVFLTFFQISYVLPYCLTLALGERQSIISEVQTQRKKSKYDCKYQLSPVANTSTFFKYCVSSDIFEQYPNRTINQANIQQRFSHFGVIIEQIQLQEKSSS